MRLLLLASLIAAPIIARTAAAQDAGLSEPKNAVFAGVGKQAASSTPAWSVGYLYLSPTSSWTIGGDFAGEGASRNNTTGNNNTIEQAFSFNLLVGQSLRVGHGWRIGVAGLLGARTTNKSCDSSYLGYQCYADTQPTVNYTVNAGGLAHISYKSLMLGGRLTGESTQAIVGVSF
jgi:hypothetical protein